MKSANKSDNKDVKLARATRAGGNRRRWAL